MSRYGLLLSRLANIAMPLKNSRLFLYGLAILLNVCVLNNTAVADESSEQKLQLEVAYLYHFTKFTEWPIVSPVFHYCVYEDSNFTALLEKSFHDKAIGVTKIEVKNINAQTPLNDCQIVYFPQAAQGDLLSKASKLAILSVGTQKDFTELGGIIYLYEEDQKMRFYVDNKAATDAGLKISSQLLKLSKEP